MRTVDIERFWGKVERKTGSECWEWTAGKTEDGYGRFKSEGKQTLAHRFAWQIENGSIPENLCILHQCDNRKCINPKHLFIGTKADNVADMVKKGRQAKGENGNAKLDANTVLIIRRVYEREEGATYRELADVYGVSIPQIYRIVNRKQWSHIK